MALSEAAFPISAIALETGISRRRLRQFRDSTHTLDRREKARLAQFLVRPENSFDPLNEAKFDAVARNLVKHSVAYVIRQASKSFEATVASGTLVRLGGRLFVATAAHTIPSKPIRTIVFQGDGENRIEGVNVDIMRHGKSAHDHPDVGYFELANSSLKALSREPIELARLSTKRGGTAGRVAFLFGYPSVWAKPVISRRRRTATIPLRSIFFANFLLARDEWPDIPQGDCPSNWLVDVFMAYPDDEMVVTTDESETRIPQVIGNKLPSPNGTSGGGIWQGTPRRDGLWSAESVKLVAVQSSWLPRQRYTRGVQVHHWLRLIHDEYPDLRDELSAYGGVARHETWM